MLANPSILFGTLFSGTHGGEGNGAAWHTSPKQRAKGKGLPSLGPITSQMPPIAIRLKTAAMTACETFVW